MTATSDTTATWTEFLETRRRCTIADLQGLLHRWETQGGRLTPRERLVFSGLLRDLAGLQASIRAANTSRLAA